MSSNKYAPAADTPSQEMSVMPEFTNSKGGTGIAGGEQDDGLQKTPLGDSFDSEASAGSGTGKAFLRSHSSNDEDVAKFQASLPKVTLSDGLGPFSRSLAQRARAAFTPRLALCIVVRGRIDLELSVFMDGS